MKKIKDSIEVIVYDKKTGECEITYLDGKMAVDGFGAKTVIYIASPGHHRGTKNMKVIDTQHIRKN